MRPVPSEFAMRLTALLALVGACAPTPPKGTDDTDSDTDTAGAVDSDPPPDSGDTDTDPLPDTGDTDTDSDSDSDSDTDSDTDTDTDSDTFTDTHTDDTAGWIDLSLLAECPLPVTWTPDTGDQFGLVEIEDCIPIPDAEDCPDITEPLPWFGRQLGRFCYTQETVCVTAFLRREPDVFDTGFDTIDTDAGPRPGLDRCCYTYVGVVASYDCGRPFKPAGQALAAPVRPGIGWARSPARAASGSDAALARWEADAVAEHASIAAFAGVVMDLLAHGAPAALVAAAQAALGEEVAHAAGAFEIASRLAGQAVGPGPMDTARPSRTLVEVAVEAAVEGGLGEALAAATAAARLAVATEPDVRAHLQRVVEDEARHAVLGWRIVDWAVAVGGAPVATAVDAALADAVTRQRHAAWPAEPVVTAWGLPGSDAIGRARQRVLDEIFASSAAA